MWVGIDISKASFDACWDVSNALQSKSFDYSDDMIQSFLSKTDAHSHYVMEATGTYHVRLALALHNAGRKVSVVNPLVIKRYGQMRLSRVKSDKADARLIYDYAVSETPALWEPVSEALLSLQQTHGWMDDLIREQTRMSNREEALRHQVYVDEHVRKDMKHQRKQLKESIKKCELRLKAIVKKCFADLYQCLTSVPGIGCKTAVELLVATHGFTRFDDAKSLAAYAGVSPTTHQSGSSIRGRGGISKQGRGRLRQLLYLGGWTARRTNRDCRLMYERLKNAGKPPKQVSIAIAHKLLRQAFAVGTTRTMYREYPLATS